MDSSLELFFVEFKRKLDELEARWERRFSPPGTEQLGATQHVVADNWGGLFEDPAYIEEEHACEAAAFPPPMKVEQVAAVVPDNWGGLFEQPDHASEVRGYDFSTDVVFTGLASSVQIRISESEEEPVRLLGPHLVSEECILGPTATAVASSDSAPNNTSTDVSSACLTAIASLSLGSHGSGC